MKTFMLLIILNLSFIEIAFGKDIPCTTKYDEHFRKYSKRFFGAGFDWHWFKAQAIAESNLKPKAKSTKRAKGIMQVLPSTYNMMRKKDMKTIKKNIYNPRSNIAAGIAYNHHLWKRWKDIPDLHNRLHFTFASYNAGYSTINKAQRVSRKHGLDDKKWASIEKIASKVRGWNQGQTIHYVSKIKEVRKKLKKTRCKHAKKIELKTERFFSKNSSDNALSKSNYMR